MKIRLLFPQLIILELGLSPVQGQDGQMRATAAFLIPPGPKGGKISWPWSHSWPGRSWRSRAAGCSSCSRWPGGRFRPPRSAYQGLKIYQPTAQGWPLGAMLLLENPNNQALNLLGYDYQLWIEGKSVAQGTSQQPVNLPPMGRR